MTKPKCLDCKAANTECPSCRATRLAQHKNMPQTASSLALLYPKYHKAIPKEWETIDTYAVGVLFPVEDPSGCILHARKKLLVPGVRTGGKSMYQDIKEARDTLNRWLQLYPES